jgi:hypothetical protein
LERYQVIKGRTLPASLAPSLEHLSLFPATDGGGGLSGPTLDLFKGLAESPLRGECLIFASLASLNGGGASLSSLLEPAESIPEKYYLTPRACAGILKRAQKRGKLIPEPLLSSLKAVAQSDSTPTTSP